MIQRPNINMRVSVKNKPPARDASAGNAYRGASPLSAAIRAGRSCLTNVVPLADVWSAG